MKLYEAGIIRAMKITDADERTLYMQIAQQAYPRVIDGARDLYPDEPERVMAACAEQVYYYEHGCLPEWATVIERVLCVGAGLIFVHAGRQ